MYVSDLHPIHVAVYPQWPQCKHVHQLFRVRPLAQTLPLHEVRTTVEGHSCKEEEGENKRYTSKANDTVSKEKTESGQESDCFTAKKQVS